MRQADAFSCYAMSIDGRIKKVQECNSWYQRNIDKKLQCINHENGMNHRTFSTILMKATLLALGTRMELMHSKFLINKV